MSHLQCSFQCLPSTWDNMLSFHTGEHDSYKLLLLFDHPSQALPPLRLEESVGVSDCTLGKRERCKENIPDTLIV